MLPESLLRSSPPTALPAAALLRLRTYSLCLALFFALIKTLPPALPLPPLLPPYDGLFPTPAPKLDLVREPEEPATPALVADVDAARCDASLAITREREILGLRPGSALGLTATTGFATAPAIVDPAAASDVIRTGVGIEEGLVNGLLKTPRRGVGGCLTSELFVICWNVGSSLALLAG